jgi:hypothetical protein
MFNLARIAGFLLLCGIKNRVRRQIQRMRQPRHFVGMMVALAYLWFVFGRRALAPGIRQSLPVAALPVIEALLVVSALFSVFAAWFFGSEQPTLSFSEAEVHFFFPAPITRRMLLHYKLSKSLLGTLLSAAVSTVFFGAVATGHPLNFLLGAWLAFFTLTLHLTGATLTRASLVQQGRPGWRRRWPAVPVAMAVIAILVWSGSRAPPLPPIAQWSLDSLSRWATDLMDSPPLAWLLLPIRAPIRVAFAQDGHALLAALVAAIVVAAIHYLWVLSTQVSFEEASLEYAEQRARLAERRRSQGRAPLASGKRKPPFALSSEGRPEMALVWKNVIAFVRGGSRPTFGAMLVVVVLFVPMLLKGGLGGLWLSVVCLMLAAFVTLVGPDTLRVDLRQDIRQIDLLRSFPLSGRRLLWAEALGPTLMLGAVQLVLLAASLAVSANHPLPRFGLPDRIAVFFGLALFLPTLTFFNVLVRNAAVLVMPSWMAADPYQSRGLEMMGQRLLLWVANLLVMLVAVLPSGFVAALGLLVFWSSAGLFAIPLAGALATGVMILELHLGLRLLGQLFDKLDATA